MAPRCRSTLLSRVRFSARPSGNKGGLVHCTRRSSRAGLAAPLVIGFILVLLAFGLILRGLSGGAYRETDSLHNHLRAVSVGEAMFGEISARLQSTPWAERWFRNGPQTAADVPIAGGLCTYVIQDAPEPPPPADPLSRALAAGVHHVDLLLRASYDNSQVNMFWRLTCPEDTIDPIARIVPAIYTYVPETTPVGGSIPGPLITVIQKQIDERERNRPGTDALVGPIRTASTPSEIASAMGGAPVGNVVAPPASGGGAGGALPPAQPPIALPTVPPRTPVTPPSVPSFIAARPSPRPPRDGQGEEGEQDGENRDGEEGGQNQQEGEE